MKKQNNLFIISYSIKKYISSLEIIKLKKKKNIILYILYLVLFIIIVYTLLTELVGIEDFKTRILLAIGMSALSNVFYLIILIPFVVGINSAKRHFKYEKLSKEDILNNKELYRDILYKYSPSTLAYIDNMEFDYNKTIVLTLLYLKQKKIIDFDHGKIMRFNNTDHIAIRETENIILNSIQNNKITIDEHVLKNYVIKDALKQRLIEANYNFKDKAQKHAIRSILIFVFMVIIFLLLMKFNKIVSVLLIFFIPIYLISSIIFFITYFIKHNEDPCFRTKKGEDINRKLEGLKNYIKEYSLLKDKNDNSIELWEEYLIYSVLFNQNQVIVKEYTQYL